MKKLTKTASRGRSSSAGASGKFKASIAKSKALMKKIQEKNTQEMGNFCYPRFPNNMKIASAIYQGSDMDKTDALVQYMAKSMKGKHLKKHLKKDDLKSTTSSAIKKTLERSINPEGDEQSKVKALAKEILKMGQKSGSQHRNGNQERS